MKKILIIIALAFCLFQMIVLATVIEIGSTPIDGDSASNSGYTYISKTGAANASGTITQIEVWSVHNLDTLQVGIFEEVDTNIFTTRGGILLPPVTAGAKRTFTEDSESASIALPVEIGDYIGLYITGGDGDFEKNTSGGSGYWYISGADHIPCTEQLFSLSGNTTHKISIYGLGATEEEGNAIMFGMNF